ncbi:MAG: molybdopterin-binding protein [Desulfobacterales bacterium]|nr:molybdopterin-binding protein [Desulfobacterales bacterium]
MSDKYYRKIKIEDAVGTVLVHDMTRIIPGKSKGVGFKKGHIVCKEDLPELLKIGKQHVYALDLPDNQLHEDDAALRIAKAICGEHLEWSEPREGKSAISVTCNGLLKINTTGLKKINRISDIIIATIKTESICQTGKNVAATRIIPLIIPDKRIKKLEEIASKYQPILEVKPFKKMRVGGIVTGYEIYNGLIKDEFDKYVGQKVIDYGCDFVKKIVVPDEPDKISNAVKELKDLGCELILTTGGMSVDPDDVTRQGIRKSGAKILFYGTPVLPGAMFLYANLGNITIMGLPACVFFHKATMFDLMLTRVLAGEKITKNKIADMGHGGLCMNCKRCVFPDCPFGK